MTNKMSGRNLEKAIKASGMKKSEVARAKGIAPETLSRIISGKFGMNASDAEEFARILKCSPSQILFERKPIEIFGTAMRTSNNVSGNIKVKDASEKRVLLYNSYNFSDDVVCIRRENPAQRSHIDGMLYFFSNRPIQNTYVDERCLSKKCVVKLKTNEIHICILYQTGDTKYRIHDSYNPDILYDNVEVQWASRITWECLDPIGEGFEEVD